MLLRLAFTFQFPMFAGFVRTLIVALSGGLAVEIPSRAFAITIRCFTLTCAEWRGSANAITATTLVRIAKHRIRGVADGDARATLDVPLRDLVMNRAQCSLNLRFVLLGREIVDHAKIEQILAATCETAGKIRGLDNNVLAKIGCKFRSRCRFKHR